MKSITHDEYQKRLGISIADGQITAESRSGVCSLLRRIIRSQTTITKRHIHQRFITVLRSFDVQSNVTSYVDECLDILCSINEIAELYRQNKESVFIAARPQWIRLDEHNAVLLGNISNTVVPLYSIDNYDVVRRFVPNDENIELLYEVEEMVFPVLPDFALRWSETKEQLQQQNEEPINEELLFIGGQIGDFWGSCKNPQQPTGRWSFLSAYIADGIYFGCIPKNNGTSWLIVNKCGNVMQTLPLYDYEEWLTLFLQHAIENTQLFYSIEGNILQFSIPLPTIVKSRLRLWASEQPQWGRWHLIHPHIFRQFFRFDSIH